MRTQLSLARDALCHDSGIRPEVQVPVEVGGLVLRALGNVDYDALVGAYLRDRGRYLQGLETLRFLDRDRDQWNAEYITDRDEIVIQPKFMRKDMIDKIRTLLHEAGHRAHDLVDHDAWRDFLRFGLGSRENFLATANPVHLDDLEDQGYVVGGDDREVFAESYARFCLGLNQPDELNRFWQERLS